VAYDEGFAFNVPVYHEPLPFPGMLVNQQILYSRVYQYVFMRAQIAIEGTLAAADGLHSFAAVAGRRMETSHIAKNYYAICPSLDFSDVFNAAP
jgi:hypothetical protein